MRISDWSSDVCSSDLHDAGQHDKHRDHTVIGQLLADLWPDEFTALDRDPNAVSAQRIDHPLAQCRVAAIETGFFRVGRVGLRLGVFFRRQANREVARVETLYHRNATAGDRKSVV